MAGARIVVDASSGGHSGGHHGGGSFHGHHEGFHHHGFHSFVGVGCSTLGSRTATPTRIRISTTIPTRTRHPDPGWLCGW
jgi:hypothetical protein